MVVLDACAIIAYLNDEKGSNLVEEALISYSCFIHAINMCEVYKDFIKRGSKLTLIDQVLEELYLTGLIVAEDMDSYIWKEAASLKAHNKMALADCIGLTYAKKIGAKFYTADYEFDPLAKEKIYNIVFIREKMSKKIK